MADRNHVIGVHPVHAMLLAAAVPLFLGGLLSDIAYFRSHEIQWSNFAAWLIAGAMVFVGFSLLWAAIDWLRGARGGRPLLYVLVLAATFIVGLLDNFVHARDAWAVMPTGLILTAIATLLALVALWLGYWGMRRGVAR